MKNDKGSMVDVKWCIGVLVVQVLIILGLGVIL